VSPSVCATAHIRSDNTGCSTDESAAPLASAGPITCSAFFVGKKGHRAGIELLFNDNGTWTSVASGDVAVARSIYGVFATVPNLLGTPFIPGQYACRFSLDGQVLVEKPFSLA
jgi:hypothetical protein